MPRRRRLPDQLPNAPHHLPRKQRAFDVRRTASIASGSTACSMPASRRTRSSATRTSRWTTTSTCCVEGTIAEVSKLLWFISHRYARSVQSAARRGEPSPRPTLPRAPRYPTNRAARAVSVYIAMNPVRAGLSSHPLYLETGSYRAHVTDEPPRPHLSTNFTRELFISRWLGFEAAIDVALKRKQGGGPRSRAAAAAEPDARARPAHREIYGYTRHEIAGQTTDRADDRGAGCRCLRAALEAVVDFPVMAGRTRRAGAARGLRLLRALVRDALARRVLPGRGRASARRAAASARGSSAPRGDGSATYRGASGASARRRRPRGSCRRRGASSRTRRPARGNRRARSRARPRRATRARRRSRPSRGPPRRRRGRRAARARDRGHRRRRCAPRTRSRAPGRDGHLRVEVERQPRAIERPRDRAPRARITVVEGDREVLAGSHTAPKYRLATAVT